MRLRLGRALYVVVRPALVMAGVAILFGALVVALAAAAATGSP